MRTRWLAIVFLVFLSLTGCNLFKPPASTNIPKVDKQTATKAVVQEPKGTAGGLFDIPGNPIDVEAVFAGESVTQVISTQGGSLQVSGADGTKYTLTIPQDALLVDTEIKMIPIVSISGLPFSGGLIGGVKLEPDGLTFDQFVTLKIDTTRSIALQKQVLFGFEASGSDLHLAIPGNDPKTIEIRLLHFSGAGLAEGTSEEKAAVYKRMADRVDVRLTNEIARYLQDLRIGKVTNLAEVQALFDEYYNSVVVPRLKVAASASGTCADGTKALQTYLGWSRQLQLLGIPTTKDQGLNILADYGPVIAKKCFDEEFDRCSNKHLIAGMIPAIIGFERQGEILGLLNPAEPDTANKDWVEARDYGISLLRKCFQWDLEFSSTGKFIDGTNGYDSSVSAKIPIRAEGDITSAAFILTGKSALVNDSFEFKMDPHPDSCNVTSNRGGGEFQVMALTWESEAKEDPDGTPRFYVKDFKLSYFPGNTSESVTLQCWNPDPPHEKYPDFNMPPSTLWSATFIMNHYKELTSGSEDDQPPQPVHIEDLMSGAAPASASTKSYLMQHWNVNAAEIMATRSWQGNSDQDAQVFEGGEFKLIHHPQH